MSSPRTLRAVALASAVLLPAGLVSLAGPASADNPLTPKSTFTMVVNPADGTTNVPADGESVPNVDSVKSTIRAYYNASGGKADKTASRYITQVHAIENQLLKALPNNPASGSIVVFDVDDTLLWNYDYEDGGSNFNYDPTTNAAAVAAGFPAVPGMPATLKTLAARGYLLYGITGRPAAQEQQTLDNLTAQGFTAQGTNTPLFNANTLFTKDPVVGTGIPTQGWVDCNAGTDNNATNCSTVEFKAATRAYIQTLVSGGHIVMNVGDQFSDLQGGFSDETTKIPNPTYFLASADLKTAPASDALLVEPTSYVMQPDGSSGYSVASGDDIPNIDPVRKMIRGYYGADSNGVANKTSSPYISQLNALEGPWTDQVTNSCATKATAYTAAAKTKAALDKKVARDRKAVKKAKNAVKKAKTKAQRKAAQRKLALARQRLLKHKSKRDDVVVPDEPALVFDADDTTLWNYDLEDGVMKFVFDPAKQQVWISGHLMPAVPGMVALVKAARAAGCAIFGVTGRSSSQQADTIANLTEKGYVDAAGKPLFTAAQYYTKGAVTVAHGSASIPTQPWVDCGGDNACSTIEYKASTRGHIEDQGYDIVGNFGDQYSDLIGGFADHVYKIPNPTYYLP
jgi:predicted secreted acid phosphatase